MTENTSHYQNSFEEKDPRKLIVESTSEGAWIINIEGISCFVNQKFCDILQCQPAEILDRSALDFIPKSKIAEFHKRIEHVKNNNLDGFEFQLITKSGTSIWTHINLSSIIENGQFKGVLAMVSDITNHKINVRNQEEEHRNYISLFEDSPVPIWDEDFSKIKLFLDDLKLKGITDVRKYFEEHPMEISNCAQLLIVNNVNQAALDLNEIDSKEFLLKNYTELIDKRSASYALNQFEAIFNNERSCEFDAELRTFKGNVRHVHLKWTVVKGYEETYEKVYLSTTDVTKRIIAENSLLKSSNKEKELLLKEIHHRVKNNLQITTSLLKLQSNSIEDAEVRGLFELSLHRINSMALVHELLYQSKDFSRIDYGNYLETLIHPLIESLKNANNTLDLQIEIHDISLNINTSIPLGLIINEIITNSLKHGLENEINGRIYINLQQIEDNNYELHIGDNGKGYSKEFNIDSAETLGLQLIISLAEQLSGSIKRDLSKKGTHYILLFKELPMGSQQ